MGRLPEPKRPGKVLTTALRLGLSATLALARERVTKDTRHLYKGGKGRKGLCRIWKEAQSKYSKSVLAKIPDATPLQRAENNIRRSFNKIIMNTAARYGNTEEKRRRRKENKKYLNQLGDYAGSRMRDIAADRYSFPGPVRIVLNDGTEVWGYPRSSRNPQYIPTHSMAELDFIDMIRSHTVELHRQCLRYGVSQRTAKKYTDELIDRLVPFLDYVYSDRRVGRPHFTPDGARELREIVLRIQALFGMRNGRPQSITASISETMNEETLVTERSQENYLAPDDVSDEPGSANVVADELHEYSTHDEYDTESISEIEGPVNIIMQMVERCQIEDHQDWKTHIELVKRLVKDGILTHRDAEHLLKMAIEESRRIGVAFHDFIANAYSTHRPFSLFAPVRHGDSMVLDKSGLLLTAEVPVADGRGRVDLVLFRRKVISRADVSQSEVVWEPCMAIEIKTRSAFGVDMYAMRTKSTDTSKRVAKYNLERQMLAKEEWDHVLASMPSGYETKQLKAYERAILTDYRRIARADPDPPKRLTKAVLVADSKENWEDIRENLLHLVKDAYSAMRTQTPPERELFQCRIGERILQMGLIVLSDRANVTVVVPPKRVKRFDPFFYSKNRADDRMFILYLSVSGKGSPAESAARVAAKWHGLQYIHRLARRRHRDVRWFDLTGEYSDPILRDGRLRLGAQADAVKRFFRLRVKFIDLSSEVRRYIYGDGTVKTLANVIYPILNRIKKPIIVVTGWDMVRKATPDHLTGALDEFLLQFIADVPEGSKVIWFDRPVPISATSQRYDTRCVAPFYSGSPWMYFVDEIVWNLPMPPPRSGSHAPADDDVRIIVRERDNDHEAQLILVDVLQNWGERFRSDVDRGSDHDTSPWILFKGPGMNPARGRPSRTYGAEDIDTPLELLPHISPFEPMNSPMREGANIIRSPIPDVSEASVAIAHRLSFAPYQVKVGETDSNKGIRLEPIHKINSTRDYRSTRLYVEHPKVNTRPPHEGLLEVTTIDDREIIRTELAAMRRTLRFLERNGAHAGEWKEFLNALSTVLERMSSSYRQKSSRDMLDSLRGIRRFFELESMSKELWNMLRKTRSWLPSGLTQEQYQHLSRIMTRHPDIFMITGNHLFLILLAAIKAVRPPRLVTHLAEELWDHVRPWQLTQLGLTPKYHETHKTGESVLHRTKLYASVLRRTRTLGNLLEKRGHTSNVLFGQAIIVERKVKEKSSALWLLFQSKPGSHEMNATLIPLVKDIEMGVHAILRGLIRDKPYWGETDLTMLSESAGTVQAIKTPIMIAEQRGLRGLWVLDAKTPIWVPVGRLEYYTRKRETVTLLRSLTLRTDASLGPIPLDEVRRIPVDLEDLVEIALEVIRVAFAHCESVTCKLSMDHKEEMFSLSLHIKGEKEELHERAKLLVRRTVDLLEILRRPDFECEPVVVDEERFVWNRFKDIRYEGDARLLRPWVERKSSFRHTDIELPPTAREFIHSDRRTDLRLDVYHDTSVCPLRNISEKELKKRQEDAKEKVEAYLKRVEGSESQPDSILNESMYRHGTCWRIGMTSKDSIPEGVRAFEMARIGGPALGTLLKTGALMYNEESEWIVHEFNVPDVGSLPREFAECVHLVESYRSLIPDVLEKLVVPGTYLLPRVDRWIVSLAWSKSHVRWTARSELKGTYYRGTSFDIELNPEATLETMTEHIMNAITHHVSTERISEPNALRERIQQYLRGRGYHPENQYEIILRREGRTLKYALYEIKHNRYVTQGSIVVKESWTARDVWRELRSHPENAKLSDCEIINEERLETDLNRLVAEVAADDHRDHEFTPLFASTEEEASRIDPMKVTLKYGRLSIEAKELLDSGQPGQALGPIEESIKMLETMSSGNGFAEWYLVEALALKVKALVGDKKRSSVSPHRLVTLLDRMYEAIPDVGSVWKLRDDLSELIKWALALREKLRAAV